MKRVDGVVAGYDPGGNGGHGLAIAEFQSGKCKSVLVETLKDSEDVISRLESVESVIAIGIDTLAAWATGPSGWRPADLWLRSSYPKVRNSIVSPNGLYGSMGINGMAVLASIRKMNSEVQITETHPKVLYWALTGTKYDYVHNSAEMDSVLSEWLNYAIATRNDHEWDAVISVLAALRGVEGDWPHDLFKEPVGESGRLVYPVGEANYWWPD